jgi:MoaA/NifB/PqqE/SkfB family radical SAM enzyme
MNTWNILYRGSLSSCNYACGYCPFAKTSSTRAQLSQDEFELKRFATWIAHQSRRIGVLFTPWGEALVHRYYRRSIASLSHLPNLYRIAVQTNLSGPLDELLDSDRAKLALWTTFHPSQTSLDQFQARCAKLDEAGIRYSVGVVGLREHFPLIEAVRRALRPEVYVWINAFKKNANYYETGEIERLQRVDPYFYWNLRPYRSLGKACRAGDTTFAVDGAGAVRRCHFIPQVLGNIYEASFPECLKKRLCSAETCSCHIGYVHRPTLHLEELYGDGLLERIPSTWPAIDKRFEKFGSSIENAAQPAGTCDATAE